MDAAIIDCLATFAGLWLAILLDPDHILNSQSKIRPTQANLCRRLSYGWSSRWFNAVVSATAAYRSLIRPGQRLFLLAW